MPPLKIKVKFAYNAWVYKWRVTKGNGVLIKSFLTEKSAVKFATKLEGKNLQKIQHTGLKIVLIGFRETSLHGVAIAIGVAASVAIMTFLGFH